MVQQSTSQLREIVPQMTHLTTTSRWQTTSDGSLLSAWAGTRLKFVFSGSALIIRFGSRTERKDRWNGGTRMLEISVSPFVPELPENNVQADNIGPRMHHLDAHSGLVFPVPLLAEKCVVEVTLIDWASIVEIKSFLVDETSSERPLSILVIGDSISCGFTTADEEDGGEALPRGCLDAYPFRAKRILERIDGLRLDVELVAYPGAMLVEPADDDSSCDPSFSMSTKFMHVSPWSDQQWQPAGIAEVIVVALGTNDENTDVPFDRFTNTLKTFTQKLITTFPSVKEIWIIPPFEDHSNEEDRSKWRKSLLSNSKESHAVSSISTDAPVFICDIQDGMKKELTVDGLHPNVDGQEVLARNFAAFVQQARRQRGVLSRG